MATTNASGPTAASTQPVLPGITRYADVKNAAKPVNETMGKTEFLTLFTTQLQNQNPLDPVNNEAFVAQLAQFSQLEATTNMSTSMENMAKSMKGERFMSGANLIGKQVTAPMGLARFAPGTTISGLISMPTGADSVSLDVYDANNKKVFNQTLGRQMPGDLKLSWDGSLTEGGTAAAGNYKIVATINSLGKVTQTPISTPMTVKSVTYSPADDDLIIEVEGGGTVPLSQLSRIEAPLATAASGLPGASGGVLPAGGVNALVDPSTAALNDRINADLSKLFGRTGSTGTNGVTTPTGSNPVPSVDAALRNLFNPVKP